MMRRLCFARARPGSDKPLSHVEIIPRRVRYDFEDAPIYWARNLEFAHIMNAFSPLAPYLEPYLNKVMARVRDTLPETEAQLRTDLNNFIAQESNHYRLHARYNKRLHVLYPELMAAEAVYWAEYKDFLANKSLVFNAAYCAGFETMATAQAKFYFVKCDDLFKDADPRVATLFKWHFAEEFEHRCVAHDAFKAISGNYFWRIYGLFKAFFHLNGHAKVMQKIIFAHERKNMTPDERKQSIKRERAYNLRMAVYNLPRLAKVFVPFYNPATQTAPQVLHDYLKHYEKLARDPSTPFELPEAA